MGYATATGGRLSLAAVVHATPGISSISPSAGSPRGGRKVTIQGHDFTGTTAVSFGSLPAKSFTVDSDTQITAISPAEKGGKVDVSVNNPGQSPLGPSDLFTYACIVPKLQGKTLGRAKKALKASGCRLGKVKPKGQRTGTVKKQRPKSGKVRAAGAKVKITLG